jgi:uncharacterized DUF497 family protein
MRIADFEWDDGNVLHLALGHGIDTQEAEEVFAVSPCYKKTRGGHYVAFGPTQAGRLLVIVFERKPGATVRPITGWDMNDAERRYFERHRR